MYRYIRIYTIRAKSPPHPPPGVDGFSHVHGLGTQRVDGFSHVHYVIVFFPPGGGGFPNDRGFSGSAAERRWQTGARTHVHMRPGFCRQPPLHH